MTIPTSLSSPFTTGAPRGKLLNVPARKPRRIYVASERFRRGQIFDTLFMNIPRQEGQTTRREVMNNLTFFSLSCWLELLQTHERCYLLPLARLLSEDCCCPVYVKKYGRILFRRLSQKSLCNLPGVQMTRKQRGFSNYYL